MRVGSSEWYQPVKFGPKKWDRWPAMDPVSCVPLSLFPRLLWLGPHLAGTIALGMRRVQQARVLLLTHGVVKNLSESTVV